MVTGPRLFSMTLLVLLHIAQQSVGPPAPETPDPYLREPVSLRTGTGTGSPRQPEGYPGESLLTGHWLDKSSCAFGTDVGTPSHHHRRLRLPHCQRQHHCDCVVTAPGECDDVEILTRYSPRSSRGA
ncbi:hypothetical protein EDB86DRAFT_2927762 [Lactarius hatsudake]|nr:hypothetical protein EDB86DRAFT_2927762 [Lactarius hatsudake]